MTWPCRLQQSCSPGVFRDSACPASAFLHSAFCTVHVNPQVTISLCYGRNQPVLVWYTLKWGVGVGVGGGVPNFLPVTQTQTRKKAVSNTTQEAPFWFWGCTKTKRNNLGNPRGHALTRFPAPDGILCVPHTMQLGGNVAPYPPHLAGSETQRSHPVQGYKSH